MRASVRLRTTDTLNRAAVRDVLVHEDPHSDSTVSRAVTSSSASDEHNRSKRVCPHAGATGRRGGEIRPNRQWPACERLDAPEYVCALHGSLAVANFWIDRDALVHDSGIHHGADRGKPGLADGMQESLHPLRLRQVCPALLSFRCGVIRLGFSSVADDWLTHY